MKNYFNKILLGALLVGSSVIPLKLAAQDKIKNIKKPKLEFGQSKKEFKKAMTSTKFFEHGKSYAAPEDHAAMIEYLAKDTLLLNQLKEELLVVNSALLDKRIEVGDTVSFSTVKPENVAGAKETKYCDWYEVVVTPKNKSAVVTEKTDDVLQFLPALVRSHAYYSVILGRGVYGDQILDMVKCAEWKKEKKIADYAMFLKQQEILAK